MALLDVFDPRGSYPVDLEKMSADVGSEVLVVGRSSQVDITIDDDKVSRRHAQLTVVADQWAIEDLGSTNGTSLNGDVLIGRRVLRDGDELRVGSTTIAFRDYADAGSSTGKAGPTPAITAGERKVLVALCRPFFSHGRFKQAATRKQVAAELFTGEPAVQQHLLHLYDKFGIEGERGERRDLLADMVIELGVVTRRDYPKEPDDRTSH
jgi:pSer/pThr/pTyr-binding forkhead associated (FHA) protein